MSIAARDAPRMLDVLIVTWDRSRVSAVQAAGYGETARLTPAWTADWPEAIPTPVQNAEAAGKWLADQWRTAGFTAKSAWLIVPREDVILRHLEMPKVEDAELPDLVRFQAASRSAVPIEQLALDFLPLKPHPARDVRDVLSATLPKASLDAFAHALKAADKELGGVSVSSVAFGDWAAHVDKHRPRATDGATLVVAWDAPRLELAIVSGNELVFAHAARIGAESEADVQAAILAEISRAVIAGQRLRPDLTIAQSWLIGTAKPLAADVSERLGSPAEVLDPAAIHPQRDAFRTLAARPLEIALLLGGVWGRTAPVVPALNFLKPRQPPPKRDPRKQQFAVGGAIALLVGFLVVGISLAWISRLDSQIDKLVTKQADLISQVNAGQGPLNAANTINDWAKRDLPQLKQLLALEDLMPGGQDRPYLSDYNYQSTTGEVLATLHAQGAAKTTEDVEALQQALQDQKIYRVKPNPITAGRDPKYPQSFTIDLDFLPEKKEPPAPIKPGA
jgi:hypothetical protein